MKQFSLVVLSRIHAPLQSDLGQGFRGRAGNRDK